MWKFSLGLALGAVAFGSAVHGQQVPKLYAGLKWRSIGPFRAGRASAVGGVAGNPAVYYMGTPGGGVWKTTDGGMIWKPMSDALPVASIGALAVAPSNPDVVYIGTGDVSEVGGSVNAGRRLQIDRCGRNVDPRRPRGHVAHRSALDRSARSELVVVAALGHTFAKDADRGIYKTTDGGANWKKTLFKDEETGAIDVGVRCREPEDWVRDCVGALRGPRCCRSDIERHEPGCRLQDDRRRRYVDAIEGRGLPVDRVGRSGVAVANGGQRVFAIMTAQPGSGLYRSDDGGASWDKATADPRIVGNGYFSKVYVDPKNADVVYVMQTSMYRSADGGKTFTAWKGAPGGDDNHVLWIDPTHSDWMVMGSDQGAVTSLDGGRTWSSW